jgi:hypothetical protein
MSPVKWGFAVNRGKYREKAESRWVAGGSIAHVESIVVGSRPCFRASHRPVARAKSPPRGTGKELIMAGGKTFKRDQKRRKEMARKLKQEEKLRKKQERKELKKAGLLPEDAPEDAPEDDDEGVDAGSL